MDDDCPREEAQATAISMIFLAETMIKLEAIEQKYEQSIKLVRCENLQDRLAEFIISSCRSDVSGKARCVGFNALTQWIISQLLAEGGPSSSRIGEAISIAVLSLFSDDVAVARFACSCLRTVGRCLPQLHQYSSILVESTITALSLVTSKLLIEFATRSRERLLFCPLLFTLAEWTLNTPKGN